MAVEFIHWKDLVRLYSVWMHILGTVIIGIFALVPALPAEVQAVIPLKYRAIALAVWAIGGPLARAIKQHRDEAGVK